MSGLIEPGRGKRDLDLGDGGTPLKLWYPPGAIYRLCEKLELKIPIMKLATLVNDHLTPQTLATFIWAGRLWEDRNAKVEEIRERLDWTHASLVDITNEVGRSVLDSMFAQEAGQDEPDPTPIPGGSGAGEKSSGLH